jgi:lysozyme
MRFLLAFPALASLALVAACSASSSDRTCTNSDQSALTVCPGSNVVHGIDVSVYQGSINWAQVRAAGKQFAIARVSDGTGYPDSEFANNWAGMKAAGVVRGAYQFFRPGEDPTAQANLFLSKLQANGGLGAGDLPPVMDIEVTDVQSTSTIQANMQTWLTKMEQGTGRRPMIYTALFMSPTIGSGFGAYPVWVANWSVPCPSLPGGWSGWKIWQYADNGSVGGVTGAVDLDEFDGTLAQLVAFAGSGASNDAGPPPPPALDGGASHDGGSSVEEAGPSSTPDAGGSMGSGNNDARIPPAPSPTPNPCGP